MTLEIGEDYVLGGSRDSVNPDQMRVGLCGLVSKWKDLTLFQKKAMKRYYNTSCECQVSLQWRNWGLSRFARQD